jgi:hypothetical protein
VSAEVRAQTTDKWDSDWTGGCARQKIIYKRISSVLARNDDDHDRSPWRDEVRGEILHGERFFVERLSVDRRLRGGNVFVERSSPWRDFSVERRALRRGSPRRDSSKREELRAEPDQIQFAKLCRLVHISMLLVRLVYFLQQFPHAFLQSG